MTDVTIKILKDDATPAVKALSQIAAKPVAREKMAEACVRLVQNHVRRLPKNKMGWPSSGFWKDVSGNVRSSVNPDGFRLTLDHPEKPGSVRQRFHGGTIRMKDKMLTIPASAEFYNQKATDFDNLKVAVVGKSLALVVRDGGTGKVDFGTGRSTWVKRWVKGQRAKDRLQGGHVAYWLRRSVKQQANPKVIPSNEKFMATCRKVLLAIVAQIKAARSGGAQQ